TDGKSQAGRNQSGDNGASDSGGRCMGTPADPKYFTEAEAAAALRKTKTWLQGWLARYPYGADGEPFYRKSGRTKLFRQSDIGRIYAAFEAPQPLARTVLRKANPNHDVHTSCLKGL